MAQKTRQDAIAARDRDRRLAEFPLRQRGKVKGDVTLYGKLARSLNLSIDDLAPLTE
jgi:hypothetical protein